MLDIRRILCPVDFSDASRHALDHAVVIAGWYGSSITALHVYSPVLLANPPILLFAEPQKTMRPTDADRRGLETRLRNWVEPSCPAGLARDVLFEEALNPAAGILTCAGSLPADLIVMGSHGRSGFERFMLGSVTEKVVRKASCAVLTVPPPAIRPRKPPFKRLLCPVDFSASSISALQFAFSIAKESDAHLTLLNVVDWPMAGALDDEPFDTPEFRLQREERAMNRLEALVVPEVRTWCEPVATVSHGKPYLRILELAKSEDTDLIVMGVHGRNAIDMMLFGSTTNQIVRQASCPVLTLKA